MKLKLKGRRFDTTEEIQVESQSAWHLQKMTSRKGSKNGGDGGPGVYMRKGTTSRVMVADRPYGEFYDFYSVSLKYFGYHHVFQINFRLKAMPWPRRLRRRLPTKDIRVRSHLSPCDICGGQGDIGTGFSPSTSVFPSLLSFHQRSWSSSYRPTRCFCQKDKGTTPRNLPKNNTFSEIGKHWTKKFHFLKCLKI
jgi:hypothetical protein